MNVPGKAGPFPRDARLRNSADYGCVFASPIRSGDALFTVLARRSQSEEARLGLVVAKKHVKLAVQRNRVKRLVRESFRYHRHTLGSLDLVVMARHGSADHSNDELLRSLRTHWARLSRSD